MFLEVLYWSLMYVLVGAMYATWAAHSNWNAIYAPMWRARLPFCMRTGIIAMINLWYTAAWPARLPRSMYRLWCGRHVPRRVGRLAEAMIEQCVYEQMCKLKKACYPDATSTEDD